MPRQCHQCKLLLHMDHGQDLLSVHQPDISARGNRTADMWKLRFGL